MRTLCTLLLFLAFLLPATARLGETEKEIEKRYGKPEVSKKDGKRFTYQGFRVWVYFKKVTEFGKASRLVSVEETFSKLNREPLSAEELTALLTANGEKWGDAQDYPMPAASNLREGVKSVCKREDGEVVAVYHQAEFLKGGSSYYLQIVVKERYRAEEVETKVPKF